MLLYMINSLILHPETRLPNFDAPAFDVCRNYIMAITKEAI